MKKVSDNTVMCSVDGHVIGTEIRPKAFTHPDTGDVVNKTQCSNRHIFRTRDQVVNVEVKARIKAYPRQMTLAAIRKVAHGILLKELGSEPNVVGLNMLTKRLAHKMFKRGVTVT